MAKLKTLQPKISSGTASLQDVKDCLNDYKSLATDSTKAASDAAALAKALGETHAGQAATTLSGDLKTY